MKITHMTKVRISVILAFSVLITSGCVWLNRDKNNGSLSTETEGLVAGVSSVLNSEEAFNGGLTSGVSDVLANFDQVAITEKGDSSVAAGDDSSISIVEPDIAEDGSICGFYNIGMSEVKSNLNVRKKASTSSEIVGKLTNHNACEILEVGEEWTKIKSGKVTGYVKNEYLITGDAARELALSCIMTVAKVTTTTLRVRSEASTDSSTLLLVGEGENLTVEEIMDDWVKVEVDDTQGYVSLEYVTLSKKLPTGQTVTEIRKSSGVSDTRIALVNYALQFVGNRYVWGGTSLTKGVDCSGFTMKVYQKFGVKLPHHSGSQPAYGIKIKASNAKPGDLFFYSKGGRINHVAIYIGGGKVVHASSPRSGIKISNAFYRKPTCVVSYLGN